jgi:hypothetical protein
VKADGKRITISEDGHLHMLVMKNVTREDAGLFAAEVRLVKNCMFRNVSFFISGTCSGVANFFKRGFWVLDKLIPLVLIKPVIQYPRKLDFELHHCETSNCHLLLYWYMIETCQYCSYVCL